MSDFLNIEESFEIQEPVINIISFADLTEKIEYQFNPFIQCPLDQNDYMKWFMTKIIKVPEDEFPINSVLYINSDNIDDYENFMNTVERCFKRKFGIMFNDEEHRFENVYNLYYFLIVKPESLIVDYLLDYHFYKPGYDFKDVYYKNKTPNISNINLENVDPIEVINDAKTQYIIEKKKNYNQMSYKEKFSVFMNYAKMIFMDETEFKFYDFFKKVNEFAPCDNYDNLDDEINIFSNISYEDESLIVSWFMNTILNEEFREVYIDKDIITPFLTQIRDFDVNMSSTMNN